MTIIVILWLVFTIIYFRREIKLLLKGRWQSVEQTPILEDIDVFGGSRQVKLTMVKNENSSANNSNKNDDSAFLDSMDAQDDISGDDVDMNYADSGDNGSDEAVMNDITRNFEDLQANAAALMAAMEDGREDERAVQAAAELRGTHLFGEIENAAGNDGRERAEKLLKAYEEGIWTKDYERQEMGDFTEEQIKRSENFNITMLT